MKKGEIVKVRCSVGMRKKEIKKPATCFFRIEEQVGGHFVGKVLQTTDKFCKKGDCCSFDSKDGCLIKLVPFSAKDAPLIFKYLFNKT